MPARKKLVSHAAKLVREAMVRGLETYIGSSYPGLTTTAAYEKIEARTGYSLSTLQRIMSGDTGPSIDTLADLAHHLGTTVSDLLTTHTEESRPPAKPRPQPRGPRDIQRSSGE